MSDVDYAEACRLRISRNCLVEDRGYTTPCWVWQRRVQHDGYSQTEARGKAISAHRLSYSVFVGPIPDGLVVDHLCRVLLCCNPDHLEAVTNQENQRRARSFEVVKACIRGHELTTRNIGREKDGGYFCRDCRNERRRTRRAEAKAGMINHFHTATNRTDQERNHVG